MVWSGGLPLVIIPLHSFKRLLDMIDDGRGAHGAQRQAIRGTRHDDVTRNPWLLAELCGVLDPRAATR